MALPCLQVSVSDVKAAEANANAMQSPQPAMAQRIAMPRHSTIRHIGCTRGLRAALQYNNDVAHDKVCVACGVPTARARQLAMSSAFLSTVARRAAACCTLAPAGRRS